MDHAYQEHDAGVGFFGFFEFVDDVAVARALLEAAAEWLRGRGMKRAIGPFNFNTNHEFGLLVDGFDTDPCIANATGETPCDMARTLCVTVPTGILQP